MDTAVVVLIIILVLIVGAYGISQISEKNTNTYTTEKFPTQYSGGGCGR